MVVIRVSEESAKKLKVYGRTYEDGVRFLLKTVEARQGEIDYSKIEEAVERTLMKYSI